ncbi:MAG TPA: alcohol dehydrogenase catalytic domain-containing protein [Dehalococcoidia bacterium]|nr:alcohol dehydrogenase catalytic domain-containing protein [Dehalococcoidia bacterium]
MKACVFRGPGDVVVVDAPMPEAGRGEVLIRVAAAGLCASDVRVYKGEKYAKPGVIPGHEFSGVIAGLGNGVEGLSVGQHVALCPIVACGVCEFCRVGKRNRCPNRITLGYDENGGMAEYVVAPEPIVRLGHVFNLPEGLPLELASLLEPTSCVLNSLELLGVGAGTVMLLIGAGPMGLLHLVLAQHLGALVIAAEPDEGRRGWARKLGAIATIDPSSQDTAKSVKELTDGAGADVAVVSAGVAAAAALALGAVKRQGTIGLFAGFPPNTVMDLDPNVIHYNEIVLTGSQNATIDQYRRTLELLPRLSDLRQIVTHSFPIDEAPKAYESRLDKEGLKSEVVFAGVS